jgi:hypothetical protein
VSIIHQAPQTANVYDKVIGLIRSYSHTVFGPSSRIYLEDRCIKPTGDTAKSILSAEARLVRAEIRTIADNKKDYETIVKGGIDKYLDVHLIDNVHDLVDMAKGYAQALVVGQKYSGGDYPEELSLEFVDNPGDLWWLVPEVTIGFFATNKEPLEAALETILIVRAESPTFCQYMDEAKTAELSSELARISPDGELAAGVDAELDRLKNVLTKFNVTLQATLKKANTDLQERMEKSTVTLKGFTTAGHVRDRTGCRAEEHAGEGSVESLLRSGLVGKREPEGPAVPQALRDAACGRHVQ